MVCVEGAFIYFILSVTERMSYYVIIVVKRIQLVYLQVRRTCIFFFFIESLHDIQVFHHNIVIVIQFGQLLRDSTVTYSYYSAIYIICNLSSTQYYLEQFCVQLYYNIILSTVFESHIDYNILYCYVYICGGTIHTHQTLVKTLAIYFNILLFIIIIVSFQQKRFRYIVLRVHLNIAKKKLYLPRNLFDHNIKPQYYYA